MDGRIYSTDPRSNSVLSVPWEVGKTARRTGIDARDSWGWWMGFCSNSFVYTRTPFPQLNNCIHIHPSILWVVGQPTLSSLSPSLLRSLSAPVPFPCSSFPFFLSPPPVSTLSPLEDSSPRSGFRAIKKRACCSRYSRRVRDRSCVISPFLLALESNPSKFDINLSSFSFFHFFFFFFN